VKKGEKNMHKSIAKIESTELGFMDNGTFTAYLHVTYGGGGQGVGGFYLGDEMGSPAGAFIGRVLKACGVSSWEELKGRTIYVLHEERSEGWKGPAVGIENLPTEPGERFLFADWQAEVRKEKGRS
jgi:hypothetical protein